MSGVAPDLARALVRWQHAAGPYWLYVSPAPFLVPAARESPPRPRQPDGEWLVDLVAGADDDAPSAVFVDLPPISVLRAAPRLNRLGFFVVPALLRWGPPRAHVPVEDLATTLVQVGETLRRPSVARGVVFVLDGDRFGRPGRPPDHRRFDNRYVYPSSSLPAATFLRRQGVAAACWIASGVAPDLRLYARHLADAGLEPRVLPPPSRADDGRVVEPAETAPGC
ncbi:MAG TPA: hypothetical protein VIN09_01685 [Chloroflexota bacterium]